MRRIFPISGFIMLIFCGCLQKTDTEDESSRLLESERSFAKSSVEQGIRDAFLSYLSDDAIIFRPHPIPAKPYYRKRQATAGLLSWEPEYADISLAGDLGYTTGPYEFRKAKNAIAADAHGHYVSIWKKQADGTWRVVLDCGIAHPKPDATITAGEFLKKEHSLATKILTKDVLMSEQQKLLETDVAVFKSTSEIGIAKTFQKYGDDLARYYRMNVFPIIGRENIINSMSLQSGYASGTPIAAGIAVSGDLAYTYGLSEIERDNIILSHSYLRIWKKSSDGQWRIVLDLENPIPAP